MSRWRDWPERWKNCESAGLAGEGTINDLDDDERNTTIKRSYPKQPSTAEFGMNNVSLDCFDII